MSAGPGLNVSSEPRLGRTPAPGQGGSAGKRGRRRELLGGPSDLQKPAGAGHSGTPLRMALSLVLGLSLNPREGKASGSEPEMPPPPTGPPGSGSACSGLGATGAPLDCPALMQAGRKHVFQGPARWLSWVLPPPPTASTRKRATPLGRSGQPTADLPTPPSWAGQAAGFLLAVSLLVCMLGEQPHIKGEKRDLPFKMWLSG